MFFLKKTNLRGKIFLTLISLAAIYVFYYVIGMAFIFLQTDSGTMCYITNHSDAIIIGRSVDREVIHVQNNSTDAYYTFTTIEVDEHLKGNTPERIRVKERGGRPGFAEGLSNGPNCCVPLEKRLLLHLSQQSLDPANGFGYRVNNVSEIVDGKVEINNPKGITSFDVIMRCI